MADNREMWAPGERPDRVEFWTQRRVLRRLNWKHDRYMNWLEKKLMDAQDMGFKREDAVKAHNEALKKVVDRAKARQIQ